MEKWEVGNGTVKVTSDGLLQCGLEIGEKYDRKKRPEEHAEDSPTPHTHIHTHTWFLKFAQEPLPMAV